MTGLRKKVLAGIGWRSGVSVGLIGRSVIRRPIAPWMALAIAGVGGTILASPTPLTPKGWSWLATSTITVSIMGMSRLVGMR